MIDIQYHVSYHRESYNILSKDKYRNTCVNVILEEAMQCMCLLSCIEAILNIQY